MLADDEGTATGTLVRFRGRVLVLTATHVGGDVTVWDRDADDFLGVAAPLVTSHDVAIYDFEGDPGARKPLPLRWGRAPRVGDTLHYTGHPLAMERSTFTAEVIDDRDSRGHIKVQGFGWPGASGAAAIDESGAIVGVLSTIHVSGSFILENLVAIDPITRLDREMVVDALAR